MSVIMIIVLILGILAVFFFMEEIKNIFKNIFPGNPFQAINPTKKTKADRPHHWLFGSTDSPRARAWAFVLSTLGIALPEIICFMLMALYYQHGVLTINSETVDGKEIVTQSINIWLIFIVTWPVLALVISWKTVRTEQVGALYAGGFPLISLNPGPLIVFPGLLYVDLDTNTNIALMVTALDEKRIKIEYGDEEEKEHYDVMRVAEITTATPESCVWDVIPDDMRKKIEGDPKNSIPPDPNHKQVILQPTVFGVFTKDDYVYYRMNVDGATPDERREEVARQVQFVVKTELNSKLKKYTYAQLIYLQTTEILNKAMCEAVNNLIHGYKDAEEGSLGLKALNVMVASLGASQQVHDAVNTALAEKFIADKKKTEGEGDKNKAMLIADGNLYTLTKQGEGEAAALRAKLDVAKSFGIDPTLAVKIDADITAFEKGKYVYLTNRISDGGTAVDTKDDAIKQIGIMIADAIRQKSGGN